MDDVVVLRWPEQSDESSLLAQDGRPRLLLVEPDADPPVVADWNVDWVRLPADERDVAARIQALARRVRPPERPKVDGAGRLLFGDGWVALSPIEARLASLLVDHYETIVSADALYECGWADDGRRRPRNNALRVHLTRLRRRVGPLGLEVRSVRSKGFVLQAAVPGRAAEQ